MGSPYRLPHRYFLTILISLGSLTPYAQPGHAQNADISRLREPRFLDMPWLVQPLGDDPSYARAEYDDSHWTPFNPYTQITTICPSRPAVVWYRLHVTTDPTSTGLSLSEWNISRAFEIYVNGDRVIASGRVTPYAPYTSGARLLARIPDHSVATGSLVIAMRAHISPSEWASGQDPGFYATNLRIGQYVTLYRDNWLTIIGENGLVWIDRLLLIGLGLVALVLFAAQRSQTEYLWIFAVGALALAESPVAFISEFRNVSSLWEVTADLFRMATPILWTSLYFSFVHQRIGWRWRIYLLLAGVLNFIASLQGLYVTLPTWAQPFVNLPFVTLLSVVIPVVLAIHFRRGNREAGILLVPVILFSLYIYGEVILDTLFQFPARRAFALRGLNLIDRYPVGPFVLSLNAISGILSTFSLAIIMLLRSTRISRRQAQIEAELEAAQQVQQVLVPEQIGDIPGFAVDTVYLPAQQVGGDFFQILPVGDGGLLVVVGDVAGKGLPAAMLVSVLVGAIRGVAEYTTDPTELLANLNDRLVGRAGGGFSTALAAHITADGSVAIANAGHLSPYLDGEEVVLPGALPLGAVSGATYETTHFYLPPGSRLTFYSDGVVEAQNPQGELFGFERSRELSTRQAGIIAESAKHFGQQDDITVVTIERKAAIATAA